MLSRLIDHIFSFIVAFPQIKSAPDAPHEEGFHFKTGFVDSTNDVSISFCEIKQKDAEIENEKIIIYACGYDSSFENHYHEYLSVAKKFPGVTVASFNRRNVGESTGIAQTENDWIDDAIAVINYFKAQGYKTENIMLIGHSLGGAILTMAAAKLYQEEKKEAVNDGRDKDSAKSVKLINNRSFSSLADVIMSPLILGKLGTSVLFSLTYGAIAYLILKYIIGIAILSPLIIMMRIFVSLFCLGLVMPTIAKQCFKPCLNAVLWLSFGTLNAVDAYKSLPDDAKDYVIAVDDGIIFKPTSSLHQGLKETNSSKKREFLAEPIDQTKKDAYFNLKNCKLQYRKDGIPNIGAHCNDLRLLSLYTSRKKKKQETTDRQVSTLGLTLMYDKIRRLFEITDTIRVQFIGDISVGCSSIILRLADDDFSDDFVKYVPHKTVRRNANLYLELWDREHKDIFREARYSTMQKPANVFVLCVDMTNKQTFENAQQYVNEIRNARKERTPTPIVLVGTKIDIDKKKHQITEEKFSEFADEIGAHCHFVSANTGDGCPELLNIIENSICVDLDKKIKNPLLS